MLDLKEDKACGDTFASKQYFFINTVKWPLFNGHISETLRLFFHDAHTNTGIPFFDHSPKFVITSI